ncbi:hypothetical protein DTO169E5_6127 [Paecilomyces variotii]|nr:hypothetical protein DTO169E5_6127 [Paecilomyces variotii]
MSLRLKDRISSRLNTIRRRPYKDRDKKDARKEAISPAAARRTTFDSLHQILKAVWECHDTYLDDKDVKSFHLAITTFKLDEEGESATLGDQRFFKPLSPNLLQQLHFDEDDFLTKRFLESFRSFSERYQDRQDRSAVSANLECYLRELVRQCIRKPEGTSERLCLKHIANWMNDHLCPDILSNNSYDALNAAGEYGSVFRVDHGYAALGSDRERQPHVIVLIQHYFDGNDKISRAEVLTILMTIMTQLEHKSLDARCITPVMIFSFMNSFQGRVLQAHVTDSGISIKKSELYNFKTHTELEDSMTLFSRYMAGYRIGDTEKFVMFDIKAREIRAITPEVAALDLNNITLAAQDSISA